MLETHKSSDLYPLRWLRRVRYVRVNYRLSRKEEPHEKTQAEISTGNKNTRSECASVTLDDSL